MASALPNKVQIMTSEPVSAAPEMEALQGLIDAFVATTLETVSAADAMCPNLRDDPEHRARVDDIIARVGEVEALMALVRTLSQGWPEALTVGADGRTARPTPGL